METEESLVELRRPQSISVRSVEVGHEFGVSGSRIFPEFWVAVPVSSVLLGNWFSAFSPWRAFARGLRWLGARLGIETTVVMPQTTPFLKIRRTRDFGASVVLTGDTSADLVTAATALTLQRDMFQSDQVVIPSLKMAAPRAASG